ncbi:hypothetical protein [Laceyella putida]|uniref:Uncharacterized protein n=1 Tax=Laceyella putida TaxID=110101 RepID=A0ABW2RG30_9BACL
MKKYAKALLLAVGVMVLMMGMVFISASAEPLYAEQSQPLAPQKAGAMNQAEQMIDLADLGLDAGLDADAGAGGVIFNQ